MIIELERRICPLSGFCLFLSFFFISLVIAQEPYMVKDIWEGSSWGLDGLMDTIVIGDILYFPANDGIHGTELWRSNGTAIGTWMVKDITPGSGDSNPRSFVEMNGIIYFWAEDDKHNGQFWKTNGTADGTTKIKDMRPSWLINVNGTLFFTHSPTQLWKSNGTPEGTVMVIDIQPNVSNNIEYLINFHDKLYFNYTFYRFWKSDGTKEGTVEILNGGANDPVEYKNELYFGYRSSDMYALARSDGTTEGTVFLKTFHSAPQQLIRVRDTLFFMASTAEQGTELWKTDGTPEGTVLIKDIYPGSYYSYDASYHNITKWNGNLYFTANDGTNGYELWKSDGTEQGTIMVKDIQPGWRDSSRPGSMIVINGIIYFSAATYDYGRELWQSDGTEEGTHIVKDINPGVSYAAPISLTLSPKKLFFYADDGTHGEELWAMDLLPAQQITPQHIIDHILNRKELPPELLPYADKNDDGCVDIADVILFAKMLDLYE